MQHVFHIQILLKIGIGTSSSQRPSSSASELLRGGICLDQRELFLWAPYEDVWFVDFLTPTDTPKQAQDWSL